MSRSKWKGPYMSIKKTILKKKHYTSTITISRNSNITPNLIGLTFNVYNGKKLNEIVVTKDMVGHKIGEFSFTRSKFIFKKKKRK